MRIPSLILFCIFLPGLPAMAVEAPGVFRGDLGEWYFDVNGNGVFEGCSIDQCRGPWGLPGDQPVVGDWVGDGPLKIGAFRQSSGMWYLDADGSGTWSGCGTDSCLGPFGAPGDRPITGDWNGDTLSAIGVFRQSSGIWYLDANKDGVWNGCGIDACFGPFGIIGDLPAVGDWNADGSPGIGVFRPRSGMWYLDADEDGVWEGCGIDICLGPFGAVGDLPVAGDWDGSGNARIAVFRPSQQSWYLDATGNGQWDGCASDACLGPFGLSGDLPVAGAWWPGIAATQIVGGLAQPVQITHAADGSQRVFIVEKPGVVRIFQNGVLSNTPFLDISSLVNSTGLEQGLLGIAFPPGYAEKQYFYVFYTNLVGIGNGVLARYQVTADPDIADAQSGQVLLEIAQPFENHNGGQLHFGPDGFLYLASGDGGSGGDPFGNAQNLGTLLGKLLRLDVEGGMQPYAIPQDNPFASEVWAWGLRNPWRFSFDRATGDLYIGDVGQGAIEEVNVQPSTSGGGENYGWNVMEGSSCYPTPPCDPTGLVLPVTEYPHADGDCSVTGGFVYRGPSIPQLDGVYLYGDFCTGRIRGLRTNGMSWETALLLDSPFLISTFGEDEAGEIYVADFGTGSVHLIQAR